MYAAAAASKKWIDRHCFGTTNVAAARNGSATQTHVGLGGGVLSGGRLQAGGECVYTRII